MSPQLKNISSIIKHRLFQKKMKIRYVKDLLVSPGCSFQIIVFLCDLSMQLVRLFLVAFQKLSFHLLGLI